jgi:hypothetical protein
MGWQSLAAAVLISSTGVTHAEEFVQNFPELSAQGTWIKIGSCSSATASVALPPDYDVDYSQGNSQGYSITVLSMNDPNGSDTRHSLDPNTKTLTSYVKVCPKYNQRAWYKGRHVLYGIPRKVTLTVNASSNGIITGNGINCGTDCSETYPRGTTVTLTATPASGFTFSSWSGACSGTTPTVTLNMDASKSCGTTFVPAVKKGVTWKKVLHDPINGIDRVDCNNCDAYVGDTACTTELPVLCIKQDGSPRPNYANVGTAHAMPVEFYNGWAGGHLATTLPVKGTSLTSAAVADATCAAAFGDGWRMATHGDGRYVLGMGLNKYYGASSTSPSPWPTSSLSSGGWGFFAYGNVTDKSRLWVRVIDQPSACWDR